MTADGARPKLAPKVRLRFDRHSGQHWLVYPDHGMSLNASATGIAQRCTGELTVEQIVEQLHTQAPETPRERIAQDVQHFLDALSERGLLHWL
jgi:pyrroloquinoline quinone biosynthesis protein D